MTTASANAPKRIVAGDGVFVRQAVDNISWIDMGESVIVVDALEQSEEGPDVLSALRETIGEKPVSHVLNTHTHYDHVALNRLFEQQYGAEIVNQQTAPLGPDGRWFEGSTRRVLMQPLPGCHTDEDCVVWVPDARVLFVGDIFGWGLIPLVGNLRPEAADLLLDTMARLIHFDARVVAPGHGPLCTTRELERWVAYFQWLREETACLCANGRTDEEIRRTLLPPDDMRAWWRFVEWKHDDSLGKMLKAVRRGWMA